ncbi:hypothetical protein NEOLI_001182 [Neolecta irregularis DAH-3]|uniref:Uncharacterized protein n=1 Tax=Neolecta irregularis (strain DAH-3) TaxID=1198029 RepID=A0A1U7LN98_NEOID|nr:hypothetical protein NEOLI_001182 [Neolecta irregularis DAH-3]|eukprot:OLL24001.1 hypothetical protein NEOLI_001182 [Neolecta irregularis DAH-3]
MSTDRLSELIHKLSPIREYHNIVSCCCNIVSCENHKRNENIVTQLEGEVRVAAGTDASDTALTIELGQALLLRYEDTVESSAVEKKRLKGEIERLAQLEKDLSNEFKIMEDRNRILASDNSRFIRMNEKLLHDLESLNLQLSSADERMEHLTENLRSTHLEIERLKRVNSSLEPQLEYLSTSNSQLSNMLKCTYSRSQRTSNQSVTIQSKSLDVPDEEDEYIHNLETSNLELKKKTVDLTALLNDTQKQLHKLRSVDLEKDIHYHYHYHLPTDTESPLSTPRRLSNVPSRFGGEGNCPSIDYARPPPSLDLFAATRALRRAQSHESILTLNARSSLFSRTPTTSSAVTSVSSVFASPRLNRTDGSVGRLKRVSGNVSSTSTSPWSKLWGRKRLSVQEEKKNINVVCTGIDVDELRNALQEY